MDTFFINLFDHDNCIIRKMRKFCDNVFGHGAHIISTNFGFLCEFSTTYDHQSVLAVRKTAESAESAENVELRRGGTFLFASKINCRIMRLFWNRSTRIQVSTVYYA